MASFEYCDDSPMDNSINSKHLLDLERPTSHAVHGQSTDNEKTEDWAYAANGCVPANAFCIDDEDIFVHPAHVGVILTPYYGYVPGMLLPEVGVVGVLPDCAKSPFIERQQYFALIGKDFFWRPYDAKKWNCIPSDGYAIKNKGHEWYLIGRCEVDGVFLVGMIFREILYIRKNDEVLKIKERYEILCKKRK